MRAQRTEVLDQYYAELLGVERTELWAGITVLAHRGRLLSFDGAYVVRRSGGVHVSAPAEMVPALRRQLEGANIETMEDTLFWRDLASVLGRRVVGPSLHAYLDQDPGAVPNVVETSWRDLGELSATVDAAEWAESGWDDDPARTFALSVDGRLAAASNLNHFHHRPRDIGVLVAPWARGRGLALPVARQAASVAVQESGFARWGALQSNRPSTAVSRRLGFEVWCSQLALR